MPDEPVPSSVQLSDEGDVGVASPMPMQVYWVLWMGVFVVLTWGMMHLFGSHRS